MKQNLIDVHKPITVHVQTNSTKVRSILIALVVHSTDIFVCASGTCPPGENWATSGSANASSASITTRQFSWHSRYNACTPAASTGYTGTAHGSICTAHRFDLLKVNTASDAFVGYVACLRN